MNNRWCIIAGPRSGSRWLEDSIWAHYFEITRFAQRLGEVIHPIAGNKCPPLLGKANMLYQNEDCLHYGAAENLHSFLKQQTDIIIKSNPIQPLTMRVFCQSWHYSAEEYVDFFEKMQQCGFYFISLDRNIFDRAVSWYMMESTGIQHRMSREKIDVYTSWSGNKTNAPTDSITVDVEKFLEFYKLCDIDNKLRLDMNYVLPVKHVNYETLIQDCADNNIPTSTNIAIKKTYDLPYKDKIANWEELMEAVKPLLTKEIYE